MSSGWLVDTFEGQGSMSGVKTKLLAAGWNELSLEAHFAGADFVWLCEPHDGMPPKRVGLQRKTPRDLLTSWWDGRLQRQLISLQNAVDIPGLLVDGWPWINHKTGAYVDQYGEFLRGKHPIPFSVWTHVISELLGERPEGMRLQFIPLPGDPSSLVRWLTKEGPERFDQEEFTGWMRGEMPPHHADPRIRALLGLPGMGIKNCEAALAHYGSAGKFMGAALRGQLIDPKTKKGIVHGIGVKTQEDIKKVLT